MSGGGVDYIYICVCVCKGGGGGGSGDGVVGWGYVCVYELVGGR